MNSEVTRKSVPTLYGTIKRVPQVDNTLTKAGCYADAKAVGDILRNEQRAVNFSYDSNGNGLKAETIQDALDELNENNKAATERIEDAEGRIETAESDIEAAKKRIEDTETNIEAAGKCDLLVTGVLETLYDIDTSKYRFIYYELQTGTGLCMINNTVPVAILKADVQEFNHTEYATANYNAEITVQIKQTGIKAYKKSLLGWNLSTLKVYGIY